ncbi:MAG: hypothetical protein K2K04_01100, partial [Clostridia bacterium]|nr:hypothetical protein [Clostridia bacterium]
MFSYLLSANDILTVAAVIVVACILIAFGFLWYFFLERSTDKDRKSNPTDNEENFEIKVSRYIIGTMIFLTVVLGACAAVCFVLCLVKVPDLSFETEVLAICVFGGAAIIIEIFCVLFKRWRVIVRGDK